ncbi:unnamed protein product [Caenorhabditis sp. 36 PRJEB53466]|nr:unnamed protein product [Caenorhabditis sp. 36 PRJEB53466]
MAGPQASDQPVRGPDESLTQSLAANLLTSLVDKAPETENIFVTPQPPIPNSVKRPCKELGDSFLLAQYRDRYAIFYEPENLVVCVFDTIKEVDDYSFVWEHFLPTIYKARRPLDAFARYLDIIRTDISWGLKLSPLYYAIKFGVIDYVQNEKKKNPSGFSMQRLTERGDTPVHVAARFGTLEMVKTVWDEHFDPKTSNWMGETVFELSSQPVVVQYISKRLPIDFSKSENKYLNPEMFNFPASFEVLKNHWCLTSMPHLFFAPPIVFKTSKVPIEDIEKAIKLVYAKDNEFLGQFYKNKSAFHNLHGFPEQYQKMILKYANFKMLNAVDSFGATPVHRAVEHNSLKTLISLWSHGADINIRDAEGYFPMDHAIKKDYEGLLKAFLVFDGLASEKVWTRTITEKTGNASRLLKEHYAQPGTLSQPYQLTYNNDNPTHIRCKNFPPLTKADNIVLSIDGGGIKGLLALQMLKEIEKIKGTDLLEWFSHFGGTSTGSIIALGLAKHRNIDIVLRSYFRLKDDIFAGSRPYSGDHLENVLLHEFGTATLSDLAVNRGTRLCIPVTCVDVSPPMLYMFRSYDLDDKITDPTFAKPQWNAARIVRASCAAPSYFPPVDGKFMDGGLVANNPTIDILTDCQRLAFETKGEHTSKIAVSIGTGTKKKLMQNVEISMPTSVWEVVKTATQFFHLKDVFIDQLTAADGVPVERARWMADAMGMAFFRFNPDLGNLSDTVAIDEKDDIKLLDAMLEVKHNAKLMHNEMHMLASILK